MVMLKRKNVLLAKLESTYGSDPTPTAAANAILALNTEIKETREPIERGINISTLSNKAALDGSSFAEVTFSVELKGSGTAGTAPRLGALLQACSMDETVVSTTSVTYEPVSSSQKSVTLWVYVDGRLHKINGAVGSVKLNATAGQLGMLEFTMTGKYTTPAAGAIVTGTYDSTVPPVCKSCTFSYNARTTLIAKMVEFDLANTVARRNDLSESTGIAGFQVTERKPVATFDVEAQLETSYNFRSDQLTTTRALSLVVGATAGNICTISAPAYNVTNVEYADEEGILLEKLTGECSISSGDDELAIAFT